MECKIVSQMQSFCDDFEEMSPVPKAYVIEDLFINIDTFYRQHPIPESLAAEHFPHIIPTPVKKPTLNEVEECDSSFSGGSDPLVVHSYEESSSLQDDSTESSAQTIFPQN